MILNSKQKIKKFANVNQREFARDYLNLDVNYNGRSNCPFCGHKNTVAYNKENELYGCFHTGCASVIGDSIQFYIIQSNNFTSVEEYNELSQVRKNELFKKALRELENRIGEETLNAYAGNVSFSKIEKSVVIEELPTFISIYRESEKSELKIDAKKGEWKRFEQPTLRKYNIFDFNDNTKNKMLTGYHFYPIYDIKEVIPTEKDVQDQKEQLAAIKLLKVQLDKDVEEMKDHKNANMEIKLRTNDFFIEAKKILKIISYKRVLVGIQGRKKYDEELSNNQKDYFKDSPKAYNFPGVRKSKMLFGLWETFEDRQKGKLLISSGIISTIPLLSAVIIHEGPADVMKAFERGYHTTVSTLGSKISDYQVLLLKKWFPDVSLLVLYDNDDAGRVGGLNAIKKLYKKFPKVFMGNFTNCNDGDSATDKQYIDALHYCDKVDQDYILDLENKLKKEKTE